MNFNFDDVDWAKLTPDRSLERTPDMHGGAKEEQIQEDPAPGWYNSCYCCGRSFEEQHMVRKEYRREEPTGTPSYKNGYYHQPKKVVTRYVISYCILCVNSYKLGT